MNTTLFRTICAAVLALAMLSPAAPLMAQQPKAAPMAPQAPVMASPPVTAAPAPSAAVPAPSAAAQPAPVAAQPAAVPPAPDAAAQPLEGNNAKALKSTVAALHELSPWSMFMSADIIVKAVMIGLAFASLVTWTVFIAKMIELSVVQGKLRRALRKVADARSLAEAQFALGEQGQRAVGVAGCRHARGAIVGRHFQRRRHQGTRGVELCRNRPRRSAAGSGSAWGCLATIGATSPFVGLFGTVWGIMNSFIGISKSQTTNLAVVAPGIAEALLATAIGLVAAIPAVIIYNHFARVTKGYLELVSRSSGAAARLLSRDLDRTHVSSPSNARSRAAE